ncbi:hypothetical protein CERZMDRAFT_119720, partial [Cercospora zeae-maydis SCOH1-5]
MTRPSCGPWQPLYKEKHHAELFSKPAVTFARTFALCSVKITDVVGEVTQLKEQILVRMSLGIMFENYYIQSYQMITLLS